MGLLKEQKDCVVWVGKTRRIKRKSTKKRRGSGVCGKKVQTFYLRGIARDAQKLAYIWFVGSLTPKNGNGYLHRVRSSCHEPSCLLPDHLEYVEKTRCPINANFRVIDGSKHISPVSCILKDTGIVVGPDTKLTRQQQITVSPFIKPYHIRQRRKNQRKRTMPFGDCSECDSTTTTATEDAEISDGNFTGGDDSDFLPSLVGEEPGMYDQLVDEKLGVGRVECKIKQNKPYSGTQVDLDALRNILTGGGEAIGEVV